MAIVLAGVGSFLLSNAEHSQSKAVVPPYSSHTTPAYRYYGLAIQVDSSFRPLDRYGRMIREIAELGANAVLFSVNGYQENAASTNITVDPGRTPTDEQWLALFDLARQHELKILLMPKILLSHPRGSEWRGVINPGYQWDRWFEEYTTFILHFARLAERGKVDVLLVGSELVSTEKKTACWKELIWRVRRAFPRGQLGYSANWDHYAQIRFWDDLDLMAMTSYYKTSDRSQPNLADLVASWQRYRRQILDWQVTVGKPILFAEVGWCSQEGCSSQPWNYYLRDHSSTSGLEEQRLNYEAFIQVWQDCPEVLGTLWWEWTPGFGGASDFGYTPRNKPAEQTLRAWFRRLRARP